MLTSENPLQESLIIKMSLIHNFLDVAFTTIRCSIPSNMFFLGGGDTVFVLAKPEVWFPVRPVVTWILTRQADGQPGHECRLMGQIL